MDFTAKPRTVRGTIETMAELETLANQLDELLLTHRIRLTGSVELTARDGGMTGVRAREMDEKVRARFLEMSGYAQALSALARTQQLELADIKPASAMWLEVRR